MKNQLKNKVVLLIGLGTACLGMSQEDQQRATWEKLSSVGKLQPREQWWFKQIALQPWRKLSNAGEFLPPHQQWWHELTVRPYQGLINQAEAMYRAAGIKPPLIRTTFVGLNSDLAAELRANKFAGHADSTKNTVSLAPVTLTYLNTPDPVTQILARQTLYHEAAHIAHQDEHKFIALRDLQLPEPMYKRWLHNLTVRTEYEAEKEALEKLPTEDLQTLRSNYVNGDLSLPADDPTHPNQQEEILMIDEELEARESGIRLPEYQSAAAESVFSKRYHPYQSTWAERDSMWDELEWLDKPENKLKKRQRIKDLGGGLFELKGQRHNFWVYYGLRNDGDTVLIAVEGDMPHEESILRARKNLDYALEKERLTERPS